MIVAFGRLDVREARSVNRGTRLWIVYNNRDCGLRILLLDEDAVVRVGHGRTSHASFVRRADHIGAVSAVGAVGSVSVMLLSKRDTPTSGPKLRVAVRVGLVASLPEWGLAFALGVSVRWGGPIALLALVMPSKQELQDCRKEEENATPIVKYVLNKSAWQLTQLR